MASDGQMTALRAASGPAADVLFLQLMTRRHRDGVAMVQAALDLAGDGAVRRLAQADVRVQQGEVTQMRAMLAARGARP